MSSFPGEIGPKLLILSAADPAGPEAALAEIASRELAGLNADVTRISLSDYPLPLMAAGEMPPLPENAVRLARHFAMLDGLLLISGERNASLPAALEEQVQHKDDEGELMKIGLRSRVQLAELFEDDVAHLRRDRTPSPDHARGQGAGTKVPPTR